MLARVVLLVGLAGLLCLGTVAAQHPAPVVSVSVGAHEGRLMPDSERAVVPIVARVGCNGQEGVGATRVEFKILEHPPYASATVSPAAVSSTYSPEDCVPGHTKAFHANLTIGVSRDAPAFKDDVYQLRVTVFKPKAGGGWDAYGPHDAQALIKNDYLPLVRILALSTHFSAPPGSTANLYLEIENHGNGPTRVSVNATQVGFPFLESLPSGEDIRLESQANKGAAAAYRQDVNFAAMLGRSEGVYRLRVEFNATYDGAGEDTLFDRQTVEFAIRAKDLSGPDLGDAPSLAPAFVIAALATAVFLRRRR